MGMKERLLLGLALVAMLAGCDTWIGEAAKPPLPGKRISVLSMDRQLQPDAAAKTTPIVLPKPEGNADWPQAGGYSPHAMHHMVLGAGTNEVWDTSIGEGSGKRIRLLAQPVVAEGKIFTMDAKSVVTAIQEKSGRKYWKKNLAAEKDDGGMGGGLAYENGRVFVATGYGEVYALDARTGKRIWKKDVSAPVRSAPAVRAGRVLVVSVDNQTHALAAEDGRVLWTHTGLQETASLLGGASPAIDGDVAVVPYSSGELFALRLENGTVLWSDALTSGRRTDQMATLTGIRGLPVMDRGRIYAMGNSDMLVALDQRTGQRLWEREIGGIQTPWVAGDYVYIITNSSELVALEGKTGRVQWVTPLQEWADPEEREGHLVWTGPILASDRLIVASSSGWAVTVSPWSGKLLGKMEMPAGVTVSPVIANKTLYVLTDDGDLVAYR